MTTKLHDIATGQSGWEKECEWRDNNEAWLDTSAKIAFVVLDEIRRQNMTKQDLAFKMGVKPQYVSRIVKGSENLTLETISKLESALGISILDIRDNSKVVRTAKTSSDYIEGMVYSARFDTDRNRSLESAKIPPSLR